MIKLDNTLETPEQRSALVQQIINERGGAKLSSYYLHKLTDYIIEAIPKEQLKKHILTQNRLITINKWETSFEGLCTKLENGEDGIYNMRNDLGKAVILTHKDPITNQDINYNPALQELRKAIAETEKAYETATGRRRYLLKKQIIAMRKDQYVIRGKEWRKSKVSHHPLSALTSSLDLYDDIYFDKDNNPQNRGPISLFNPAHIEALLCNYSSLKESCYGNFESDLWYLMEDLDNLIETTLHYEYPLYYHILTQKIDEKTNFEIQYNLKLNYKLYHSIEHISFLWHNKIPKLLADSAQKQYLIWYYTFKEKGEWWKCGRCGEIKLVHNKFFTKNQSSKNGFYSICKDCRNANSNKSKTKMKYKEAALNGSKILS